MGTAPRLRYEDKGPLHHTRTEDLRPFGTGMAEPLRAPVFHIAYVLGRSATIAIPGPQRNIRRAGVGPEQDRYDSGPWMGIDFGRLPPREVKAAPGFLWPPPAFPRRPARGLLPGAPLRRYPPPSCAACPGRAPPRSARRPCAPAGLSHRAGGAAIAAGEGWSPAGGSRGGALQRCRGHKAVYISYPPKELVGY